jgi:hypothetical protein
MEKGEERKRAREKKEREREREKENTQHFDMSLLSAIS